MCSTCFGRFCSKDAFVKRTRNAEQQGSSEAYVKPELSLHTEVRYLACPLCQQIMTRRNYCGSSGILVDVCEAHGFWLDRGELDLVLLFHASGEATRAVKRERARRTSTAKSASDGEFEVWDAAEDALELLFALMD